MLPHDDDLSRFDSHGTTLPPSSFNGHFVHDGARLWFADFHPTDSSLGLPVILLHGGLGHSGNFAHQIPALLAAGHRIITLDTRGHGRSTRDGQPYSYTRLAADLLALMDSLDIPNAHLVGWSDGACTALVLASQHPDRIASVFYFACNMDPSGTKEFVFAPTIGRCIARHRKDYAQLSATPNDFDAFFAAVNQMQSSQPNYSAAQLAAIRVPVTIAHAEHDEFIKREHADYLTHTIPNAQFIFLPNVSHFAPLQRPDVFNHAILTFLGRRGR